MAQLSGVVGNEHAPVVSMHVFVVHVSASVHVELVAHVPEPLHMPQPATDPSSQRVPVRAVHVVVLEAGVQIWHALAGLTVPDA